MSFYTIDDLLHAFPQGVHTPPPLNVYDLLRSDSNAPQSDEESDDYSFVQPYPAYYEGAYPRQFYVRPHPQAQPQRAYHSRSAPTADLLSYLENMRRHAQQSRTPDVSKSPVVAPAAAPVAAGAAATNSARSPTAEKKPEELKQKSTPTTTAFPGVASGSATTAQPLQPLQQPKAQKSHSTAKFQEPKPKVEVSSRNVRNPSIPYTPQTNIYETKESYDIVLAVSGASIKNLDIDFHPNTNELIIKGTIPPISEIIGESSEVSLKSDEIRTGSLERRVKFPYLPKIIEEKITAKYASGLLIIKVPKNLEPEKKQKRKVTIEEVPDEAFTRYNN